MTTLNATEARVVGVLVEKALTTQAQYPLSLNALVTGCNQRSNREPVMNLNEDQALDAIESLQRKGLVREAMLSGSRVIKYRHLAKDALEVSTGELVVLAELMLRGPQTGGELRQRCSRMHPIESMDALETILDALLAREQPLIERLAGSRAPRYAQLVAPGIHPTDAPSYTPPAGSGGSGDGGGAGAGGGGVHALEVRIDALEAEVERLRSLIED